MKAQKNLRLGKAAVARDEVGLCLPEERATAAVCAGAGDGIAAYERANGGNKLR